MADRKPVNVARFVLLHNISMALLSVWMLLATIKSVRHAFVSDFQASEGSALRIPSTRLRVKAVLHGAPPPPRPPRRHLRFYRLTQVTHMQPSALLFRYLTILQKRLTLPRTALQQYECAHWDKKLMIWGTMAQPGETFSPACRRLAMAMYVHYLSKVQPCCPLLPLLLSYTLQQVTDCRSCNCQRRLGTVSEASRLSGLR